MPLLLLSPPAATAAAISVSTASASSSVVKVSHFFCSQSRRFYYRRPNGNSLHRVRMDFSFAGRGMIRPMATAEPSTQTQTPILSTARKQALISLSDKKDLDLLGRGLQELGYTIISTGGTAKALEQAGITVTKVEEITSFPEMLDGRVKTLHPNIHGGILARRNLDHHMEALNEHGIGTFDIVVVNLYPFYSKVTSASGVTFEDGIENIDIGGPTLIRAAAKNFCKEKKIISNFAGNLPGKLFSMLLPMILQFQNGCGSNLHKEMSYNNYLDADAAWNCVSEFQRPTCVIVKHTNPCGVASREDILEAYRLAVKADPVSAFGGIVAFNTIIDEDLAKEIREFRSPTDGETRMFYEIVIAPNYTEKGLEILRGKSKNLRILEAKRTQKGMLSLRQVSGGWLAQDSDDLTPGEIEFKVMSDRSPQANELSDAQFAWLCVKHVKSNAIVIAKNSCMLGMGSGQPNRLESLRIAFRKAGDEARGAALASDAFFPFAWHDAVEEACQNGIGVIAEPGGSIRDGDAIDCCNKYGVALLFTNIRHFRH